MKGDIEQTLQEVLETVMFLKDNSVLREEFLEFKIETANNFVSLRDELKGELFQIKEELKGIKERLARLEKQSREDIDMNIKEIEGLKQRVVFLEKEVRRLSVAQMNPQKV